MDIIKDKKLRRAILEEIAKLSKAVYESPDKEEDVKTLGYVMNLLVAVMVKRISIDDFHDFINGAPDKIREYYYNLLFETK